MSTDLSREIEKRVQVTQMDTIKRLKLWGLSLQTFKVVDLGTGIGGGAFALAAIAKEVIGVDNNADQLRIAIDEGRIRDKKNVGFVYHDLTNPAPSNYSGKADFLVLQDVLEHVPDVERALATAKTWVREGGTAFVSFPPYYSPVGGHHHYAKKPFRFIPWLHVILTKQALQRTLPDDARYREEVFSLNRITVGAFEALLAKTGWKLVTRSADLIRPSIASKYGIPVVPCDWGLKLRGFREVFLTGVYYLIQRVD